MCEYLKNCYNYCRAIQFIYEHDRFVRLIITRTLHNPCDSNIIASIIPDMCTNSTLDAD